MGKVLLASFSYTVSKRLISLYIYNISNTNTPTHIQKRQCVGTGSTDIILEYAQPLVACIRAKDKPSFFIRPGPRSRHRPKANGHGYTAIIYSHTLSQDSYAFILYNSILLYRIVTFVFSRW